MEIREAITKYLSLPNMGILDEGIFYNVLKDLNAFEQIPASQHIMKAFITKGYLKDVWNGKKGLADKIPILWLRGKCPWMGTYPPSQIS